MPGRQELPGLNSAIADVGSAFSVSDSADRLVGELLEAATDAVAADTDLVELLSPGLARGGEGLAARVVELASGFAQQVLLALGAGQKGADRGADREPADYRGDRIGGDTLGGALAG